MAAAAVGVEAEEEEVAGEEEEVAEAVGEEEVGAKADMEEVTVEARGAATSIKFLI